MRRTRLKRLWGLMGHNLQQNKDPSLHRRILGKQWSRLGRVLQNLKHMPACKLKIPRLEEWAIGVVDIDLGFEKEDEDSEDFDLFY